MIILDPFYGVSEVGKAVCRCLNRLLIVAEIGVAAFLVHLQLTYDMFGWWFWLLLPFALRLGMQLVNNTLRLMWNLALVIIYGSTNISPRRVKTTKRPSPAFSWHHEEGSSQEKPVSGLSDKKYGSLVNSGRAALRSL